MNDLFINLKPDIVELVVVSLYFSKKFTAEKKFGS